MNSCRTAGSPASRPRAVEKISRLGSLRSPERSAFHIDVRDFPLAETKAVDHNYL